MATSVEEQRTGRPERPVEATAETKSGRISVRVLQVNDNGFDNVEDEVNRLWETYKSAAKPDT